MKIWALENNHNNMSISIIDPGKTDTPMRKAAMPGEDSRNLSKSDYIAKLVLDKILTDKIYKGKVLDIGNN